MAGSHLSRPSGESSKIVPTLTENCLRHERHFQMRRVLRKPQLSESHIGQRTPSGHRRDTTNSSAASGSAKNRIASERVSGAAVFLFMPVMYAYRLGVS